MTRTKKTVVALLAIFAVGATAVAGMSMLSRNTHAAFADTAALVDETATAPVGSEENPETVVEGVTTIDKMYVTGNPEMGFKELAYYLSFTPTQGGLYSFTHSNPDIGVNNIFSATEAPYGDWSDGFTVYSVELTKGVEYTINIANFDWGVNLDAYEVGAEYELSEPATIDIAYADAADGSSSDKAIPYEVGATIIVPQGHAPVWYTFTVDETTDFYLVAMSGTATFKKGLATTTATNGYKPFTYSGKLLLQVTPTATESAEVQVLKVADQTEGSCIVTAVAVPENGVVGGNTWYTYTAEVDKTASLKAVAGSEYIGSVSVYDGYTFIGTLADGIFTPATLPEVEEGQPVPAYSDVTLEAGKTYNFFAPRYEYSVTDEEGNVIETIDIMSVLEIK